jgi:hypothetical protein
MNTETTTKTEWAIKVIEEDGTAVIWCDTYYDNESEALHRAGKLKDKLTNNYKQLAVVRIDMIYSVQPVAVFDVVQHDE